MPAGGTIAADSLRLCGNPPSSSIARVGALLSFPQLRAQPVQFIAVKSALNPVSSQQFLKKRRVKVDVVRRAGFSLGRERPKIKKSVGPLGQGWSFGSLRDGAWPVACQASQRRVGPDY